MIKKLTVGAFIFMLQASAAQAQDFALKTNALYLATTTPNIGAEMSAGRHHSVQLFYGLNPWRQSGADRSSLRHWLLMPEYRYWFCQSFNGWFVGAHLMGGEFNMSGVDLPFGIFSGLERHRYEGWYAGGGITAGYQWPLSRHWNVEASVGLGYDYIKYDKYLCGECGEKVKQSHTNYFGPTKVALSVLYIF